MVLVHGQRGDTAAQVGAGCGEAGDAEENGERGGLHGVGTSVRTRKRENFVRVENLI